MNIFSFIQQNAPVLLAACFSLIGFILVLCVLVSRLYFVIVSWIHKDGKSKKKNDLPKKSFFTPLVGSLFIVTLALVANNWFVYALSIIIIATLVTELEFLEKVMSLLWDRKYYWDYRIQVDGKAIQEQQGSKPTVTPEIEKEATQAQNSSQTPNNGEQPWLLMWHAEKVYRLIFGSQLGILQSLALSEPQGVTKFQVEQWYSKNPISANYPFENYIGFLKDNQLITFDSSLTTLHITPVGKYFLDYIEKNNIPPVRPN